MRHLLRAVTQRLMKLMALRLLLGSLLVGSSKRVVAQEGIWPPEPELLNGGGARGIVVAIHQRLIYPPIALRADVTGRVFVAFIITPAGEVKQVVVAKSLWAPFDSAGVAAVRQLPRFKPWPQRYGNVQYTVPVNFQIGEDYGTAKKARRRNSTR